MPTATQQRKVLIFGDDASIRNLLRVFEEKLEREKDGDANPAAALAAIDRKAFDAVLLDLRCAPRKPRSGVGGIGEIQSSLMGRVLTINAEVRDAETLEAVERYLINGLPRSLLWLISDR